MDRTESVNRAQEKLDRLKALSDQELLDRAWDELSALCGSHQPVKRWRMSVPVDADRDSDILFGEVLQRLGRRVDYQRPSTV